MRISVHAGSGPPSSQLIHTVIEHRYSEWSATDPQSTFTVLFQQWRLIEHPDQRRLDGGNSVEVGCRDPAGRHQPTALIYQHGKFDPGFRRHPVPRDCGGHQPIRGRALQARPGQTAVECRALLKPTLFVVEHVL
jgi:hypothetical protein